MRFSFALLFLPLVGLGLIVANLFQVTTLLVRPCSPRVFRWANRYIVDTWFKFLRWTIFSFLGTEVVRTGENLPWKENGFLISNHQAMADIPVLVNLAHESGRMGDTKWFVKDPLKWVPGVGWGLQFVDCLFVKRNWTADRERVMETFRRLREHQVPFWVVSFLEGTRANPKKIFRSQEFARKQGLPRLVHLMLPRTKGFEATLEGLGDLTQAVYIATIGYEGPPPSLTQLFFGPTEKIHLHVRRFTDLPKSATDRAQWIIERYQEKDILLSHFHRTGSFPQSFAAIGAEAHPRA